MDPSIHDSITSDPPSSLTLTEDDLMANDKPSFDIEQVQLQFELKNGLKLLLVQNNKMCILLSNSIIRIDLENPAGVLKIKLPTISNSSSSEITNGWLHPNGLHLIVQINSSHYYFLHDTYKTLKPLTKFKNLPITQIVFLKDDDQFTTGEFLIGTSDGQILVSSLKSHTTDNKRDDKYVKPIHKFSSKANIWGLAFSNSSGQINVFCGSVQYTWDCFDTSYAEIIRVFKSAYKEVNLSSSDDGSFAVNNDTYTAVLPSGKIITNDYEISFSGLEELPVSKHKLINFLISQHHLIELNQDHLVVFNKLALLSEPSYINLSEFGKHFFGITVDEKCNTFWLYNNNSILEIVIQNESKSMWYNYFKMGRYEKALECLDKHDPKNTFKVDMVSIKKGYDCLQRGGFGVDFSESNEDSRHLMNLQIEGIKTLAESTEPFEKVSLMLLNHSSNHSSSLSFVSEKLHLEYLLVKFEIARDKDKNRIRIQILSSWIIELMLRIIYRLEKEQLETTGKDANNEIQVFSKRFQDFLSKNYKHLHRQTIYQIISDLHFPTKLIFYAELIEDYHFILYHYIDNSQWKDALKCLLKIYISEKHSNDIIYATSNILLTNFPKGTVEAWLKFNRKIDSDSKDESIQNENLLPAILTYNMNNTSIPLNENYGIQYLKQIIFDKGVKNKDVNNTYLSLLITYPDTPNNKPTVLSNFEIAGKMLYKFLSLAQAESNRLLIYNSQFVLRLCLSYKHYQTAVLILIHDLNLFEQALKLALSHNFFDLGEFVLRKYDELNSSVGAGGVITNDDFTPTDNNISKISLSDENFSRRKKLWITFAKYLIESVCKDSNVITKSGNSLMLSEEGATQEDADVNHRIPAALHSNIQDVTLNLVSQMTGSKVPEIQLNELNSVKLNQVLKYVLNLANGESNGDFIGLKDLLPLVPENIIINNFKDEIVNSLNQYNEKIGELSREMRESLEISSNLKQQIKEMSKKSNQGKVYSIIQPGEECLLCKELLIKKNFIYFPNCHHGFHKDCLIRSYLKSKNYRFKKIFENFKSNPTDFNKSELDENLVKDCILCNELNINQIDSNLIDPVFDKAQIIEWDL